MKTKITCTAIVLLLILLIPAGKILSAPPGTYSPRHHRCLCLHLFLSFRLSCHRPEHLGRFRQGICQPLHLPCISGHGEENTFRNNLCHDPKQHERFPENSVPAKLVLVYPAQKTAKKHPVMGCAHG